MRAFAALPPGHRPGAVEPLRRAAGDRDIGVATAAVEALGRIHGNAAEAALQALSADADSRLAEAARAALGSRLPDPGPGAEIIALPTAAAGRPSGPKEA